MRTSRVVLIALLVALPVVLDCAAAGRAAPAPAPTPDGAYCHIAGVTAPPIDDRGRANTTHPSCSLPGQPDWLPHPRPRLAVTTGSDQGAAHPGDPVTQTARVTNTGLGVLTGLVVHLNAAGCGRQFLALLPGTSIVVRCAGRIDTEGTITAVAEGTGLDGTPVTAHASTDLRVLQPAIDVTATPPIVAVEGARVDHQIRLRNVGNTPLAKWTVAGDGLQCGAIPPILPPGREETVPCTAIAGHHTAVTASAEDELGMRVSATTPVGSDAFRPHLDMTVSGPPTPVLPGEEATVTVWLRNPTPVRLNGVGVTGNPPACRRAIGVLESGESSEYSCRFDPLRGRVVALSASGYASAGGQVSNVDVRANRAVTIPVRDHPAIEIPPPPDVPPAKPPPDGQEVSQHDAEPLDSPQRVAGFIAILGVLVMLGTVGALSSATRPK